MTVASSGRRAALVAVALSAALAACGDKPQTAGTTKKTDAQAWSGDAASSPFMASGWKPGDQTSWEQQMKARNQNQNEYSRTR